jgi:putative heme-binding domain-containing protein
MASSRRGGLSQPALPRASCSTHSFKLGLRLQAPASIQLAFTLGEITDPRAVDALATIAVHDAADPWIRTAVLSSAANTSDQLLARLLANEKFVASSNSTTLIRELAQIFGGRGQIPEMQRALKNASGNKDVVFGIGEGLKRSGKSLRRVEWDAETSDAIERLLSQAAQTAADSQASLDARLAAIHLLTFDTFDRASATLADLLESNQPHEVQRAAVTAIGSFSQPETASMLLSKWRASAPAIRSEIVLAMLGGRNRGPSIAASDPERRHPGPPGSLCQAWHSAPQRRGAGEGIGHEAFRRRRPRPAQRSRHQISKRAFDERRRCSRPKSFRDVRAPRVIALGDLGKDVGPNLATIRQWNPEQVLINTLDPNREVAPNFIGYTVETKDGRTIYGIIAEESAASLTLKRADGLTDTVLRRDIAQLSGSGLSLMPEGLESAISVEQMADLIAFLLTPP